MTPILTRLVVLLSLLGLSAFLQADQSAYRLELNSATGQSRVQARGGQINLIAKVKPKLQKSHQLQIKSETMDLSVDAGPGPVTLKDVPRGLQSFHLVVIDRDSRMPVQRSKPLTLDVRRYIPR